ncbi:GNAT family N-acetyltransferase [Kosakonia pseudosacchari]|uniref:GNAT family N-acetyltransferase n=1 Tax=Kosakonia pseudosacchari TaxID=1646340 RepID=A0ABX4IMS5_9ENTR|nr:GNAT family N-acetyltransferase [Kosakonia pseudosacchari]PDO85485.1 GNAT family N-acetyltransferase [Kosakonia pseudosacchari]WBU47335.1 GNAT family N-acetyltransferase [Kosakonia pseudosacchari]
MYRIVDAAATQPDLIALIAALDAYQSALYPAESNHLLDLAALPAETLILRKIVHHDEAVGCGAVVLNRDGSGEMKRVFIDPRHRGQRLGEKLLAALEQAAARKSCHTLRLETGIEQHAAVKLYQRCGYQICEAFAPYSADPLSIFMHKALVVDRYSAEQ